MFCYMYYATCPFPKSFFNKCKTLLKNLSPSKIQTPTLSSTTAENLRSLHNCDRTDMTAKAQPILEYTQCHCNHFHPWSFWSYNTHVFQKILSGVQAGFKHRLMNIQSSENWISVISNVCINPSKSSALFMYAVFNIQEFYLLLTDCISVTFSDLKMVITSLYSIKQSTFMIQMQCIYYTVQAESLNIIYVHVHSIVLVH
jgi:hypothetical protein